MPTVTLELWLAHVCTLGMATCCSHCARSSSSSVSCIDDCSVTRHLALCAHIFLPFGFAGSQIEAGDLRAAASTLSEGWVVDLQRNAKALSTSADVAPVIDAIKKTQAAASKNDAKGTRQAFVAMTGSVQSYVNAAGVASFLKGL